MRGELFFRERKAPLALPEKKSFGVGFQSDQQQPLSAHYMPLDKKTIEREYVNLQQASSSGNKAPDKNDFFSEEVRGNHFLFLKKMVPTKYSSRPQRPV